MKLKSQAQAQYQYAMSHKGKAIGSALGIIAGVSYGLAGKQSNWMTAGLAIGGAVGGAILGGMFDKTPNAVVVAPSNGDGAKAPVVDNTVNQDIANDTAGDDGMMNAIGMSRRITKINHKGGVAASRCPRGLDWCERKKKCTTSRDCFATVNNTNVIKGGGSTFGTKASGVGYTACGEHATVAEVDEHYGGSGNAFAKCACYGKGCAGIHSHLSGKGQMARKR